MQDLLITPKELKDALKKNNNIQLVDVRTLDKHLAYNIGGLHIPLEELLVRLKELNPELPVVTYCTVGGKSMVALNILRASGFKSVKSLDGGMTAWQIDCA
ncbi:MAG: rhodanese-like domain-containing protein [Gammaproteobacteria bacterium]|nr:rhodanese-like domain-containing protein [Gammaproteobacteria bacterium]